MEVVTAIYMIIASTGIRVALHTAEALKVPVVHRLLRAAMHLPVQKAVALLQTARKPIHPVVVLQRRIKALWIPMMMATMQFMRTMITTGIVTGAMMTMLPVWMMLWKMKTGKSVFISSKKGKETEADIMGFFDRPLFDFNGDGRTSAFETYVGLQMMASSRQEAIALTGDDDFYTGSDDLEEDDELVDGLEMAGIDIDELADMDEDERREALEDAGLDPDDYDNEF